jgi:hypothetical protein
MSDSIEFTEEELNNSLEKPKRMFSEHDKTILGNLIDDIVNMVEAKSQDDLVHPMELEKKLAKMLQSRPGHGTSHLLGLLHSLVREKNQQFLEQSKAENDSEGDCSEGDF